MRICERIQEHISDNEIREKRAVLVAIGIVSAVAALLATSVTGAYFALDNKQKG